MMNKILSVEKTCLFFILFACSGSLYAGDVCKNTDPGSYSGDGIDKCQELYPPQHRCNTNEGQRSKACKLLNWIKLPDTSVGKDYINNPHRGLWGYFVDKKNGDARRRIFVGSWAQAAENSYASIWHGVAAGYPVIELDVNFIFDARDYDTIDEANNGSQVGQVKRDKALRKIIVAGHYQDMARSTNWNAINNNGFGAYTATSDGVYSIFDSAAPLLRKRAGNIAQIATAGDDRIVPLAKALLLAKRIGAILTIDPKPSMPSVKKIPDSAPAPACDLCDIPYYMKDGMLGQTPTEEQKRQYKARRKQEFLELVEHTIREASLAGATANVIIKAPSSFVRRSHIENYLALTDLGSSAMGRVLWAPNPFPGMIANDKDIKKTFDFIDAWTWTDSKERLVGFWDITHPLPSRYHAQNSYFVDYSWPNKKIRRSIFQETEPMVFSDFVDYLTRVTGRRFASWVISPYGPTGVRGLFSEGTIVGGEPGDYRGDFLKHMTPSWSSHALLISDRPEVVDQMMEYNIDWQAYRAALMSGDREIVEAMPSNRKQRGQDEDE